MQRSVHSVSYFLPRRDRESRLRLVETRDEAATRDLMVPLLQSGFGYGEHILNFPPNKPVGRMLDEHELHPVDLSFVGEGDLLVTGTRPPVDDLNHGDRKQIEIAGTDLERKIWRGWADILTIIARSHVQLAHEMRKALADDKAHLAEMAFRQKGDYGSFFEFNRNDGKGWIRARGPRRTAAFLLRRDRLPGQHFGLINAFGMSAATTRIWAYRLARDWSHLLEHQGFTMVELVASELPERPTDLRHAHDWKVEPVLQVAC